jgi:hypothetical protein
VGDSAGHGDCLDPLFPQAAREPDERRRSARQTQGIHDDLVADAPDDHGRCRLQRFQHDDAERVGAPLHQRMRRRVQLRSADRCGQSPDELFGA